MPPRGAISIHAAREGGDQFRFAIRQVSQISIHAAREGGDVAKGKVIACPVEFQSTPPVKAATKHVKPQPKQPGISIHAAREGGDAKKTYKETVITISIHAAREGGDSKFTPIAVS